MQGAQAQAVESQKEANEMPVEIREEDRVGYWMQRGFLAILTLTITMLVSFGIWMVRSITEINTSTTVVASQFQSAQKDLADLKASVINLSLRGENWATKDQLSSSREAIMSQISLLKDQVNMLELRVQRMESAPPRNLN